MSEKRRGVRLDGLDGCTFEEVLRGEHKVEAIDAAAEAVKAGIRSMAEVQVVRPGERYDPDSEYHSIVGAAAFFDVDPEVIRRALVEANVPYSIVLDGNGYFSREGMQELAGWLAANGYADR